MLAAALTASFLPLSNAAAANGVHLKADGSMGGGYTVRRGEDCFIVTARHVVVNNGIPARSITVTGANGGVTKARMIDNAEDLDLALLRVENANAIPCEADWQDGGSMMSTLKQSNEAIVEITLQSQVSERKRLFFAGNAGATNLRFNPNSNLDVVKRGNSGSPVYTGDHVVGILLEVDPSTKQATVLRQDIIHGRLKNQVLSTSDRMIVVRPIIAQNREHRQATLAALDALADTGAFQVSEPLTPRDPYGRVEEKIPVGTDYILDGSILEAAYERRDGAVPTPVIKTPTGKTITKPQAGSIPIPTSEDNPLGAIFSIMGQVENAEQGSQEINKGLEQMPDEIKSIFGGFPQSKQQQPQETAPATAANKTQRPQYHYAFPVQLELKLIDVKTGATTSHFVRDDSYRAPYGNSNVRSHLSLAVEQAVRKHVPALLQKGGVNY